VADNLWTEHDVSELTRHPFRHRLAPVDWKRKCVGLLVHPEMLALETADLVRRDELQPQLSFLDRFAAQHGPDQVGGRVDVELGARAICDLDLDHRPYFRRCVPVSSACNL